MKFKSSKIICTSHAALMRQMRKVHKTVTGSLNLKTKTPFGRRRHRRKASKGKGFLACTRIIWLGIETSG